MPIESGATATRRLCFFGFVVSSICSGPRWYSHGWSKFRRKEDNQAALVQHKTEYIDEFSFEEDANMGDCSAPFVFV